MISMQIPGFILISFALQVGRRCINPPYAPRKRSIPSSGPTKIATVLSQGGRDAERFDVNRWRQILEQGGQGQPVPRDHYAGMIIRGGQPHRRADRRSVVEPDTRARGPFRALGRQALFVGMRQLATMVVNSGVPCQHTRRWLSRHHANTTPTRDVQFASTFVNEVAQDIAGQSDDAPVMAQARKLLEFYNHTCQEPYQLNIDW